MTGQRKENSNSQVAPTAGLLIESTRTIVVPAPTINTEAGQLKLDIYAAGEKAIMTLYEGEEITILAMGDDFGVPEIGRWTWFDMPDLEVVGVFASFLGAAIESVENNAGWRILKDPADHWAQHMALMASEDYPRCETCEEPIDYCQGHGELGDLRGDQ